MERVIKPSASCIDYNMVKANPESYILLGFSNNKCICIIYYDTDYWYSRFSADFEQDDYEYYDTLEELIDYLQQKYNNFELMCEKVE